MGVGARGWGCGGGGCYPTHFLLIPCLFEPVELFLRLPEETPIPTTLIHPPVAYIL